MRVGYQHRAGKGMASPSLRAVGGNQSRPNLGPHDFELFLLVYTFGKLAENVIEADTRVQAVTSNRNSRTLFACK